MAITASSSHTCGPLLTPSSCDQHVCEKPCLCGVNVRGSGGSGPGGRTVAGRVAQWPVTSLHTPPQMGGGKGERLSDTPRSPLPAVEQRKSLKGQPFPSRGQNKACPHQGDAVQRPHRATPPPSLRSESAARASSSPCRFRRLPCFRPGPAPSHQPPSCFTETPKTGVCSALLQKDLQLQVLATPKLTGRPTKGGKLPR